MKVALISYWSCPLTKVGVFKAGGMSIYLTSLANALAAYGVEVDIFTKGHISGDTRQMVLDKKVGICHLGGVRKEDIYLDAKDFGYAVWSYIDKKAVIYDLFHAHYFLSGISASILKKLSGKPSLITFHTLSVLKRIYSGVKDNKREKAEKKLTGEIDAVVVSTEFEKYAVVNFYGADEKKIKVVNPGVDLKMFTRRDRKTARSKLNISEDKKIILFVGRIDPVKGIEVLIKGISYLMKKKSFGQNFEVLLIGGNIESKAFWQKEEVRNIRRTVEEKRLKRCVKFLGSKPHYLLPLYYSAADIVVAPSFYESFGLSVLEAMACGSCVVASSVPGYKFLIDDKINGRLFQKGDASSLTLVLLEMLNDKGKRLLLGRNAREKARKFSWDKHAIEIANCYKMLL